MKLEENIASVALLQPDFMGFIFYPSSPRDVSTSLTIEILGKISKEINIVGVFVDETLENVLAISHKFGFKYVQLHGRETVEYCKTLGQKGLKIIKVFSIKSEDDFKDIEQYNDVCEFYLFDTKSPKHGGTGQKFDWKLLEKYNGQKHVFLSGGISSDDVELVHEVFRKFSFIKGLDLNSKFEISPALKDSDKLEKFIKSVKKNPQK
ncbi:MAG: phosphoribosylanthranilate isomerase [Opitutaceae bacterium]|nr:phosphoribosylanthranilate isomerase [Cytophagales bacterium]